MRIYTTRYNVISLTEDETFDFISLVEDAVNIRGEAYHHGPEGEDFERIFKFGVQMLYYLYSQCARSCSLEYPAKHTYDEFVKEREA